MVEVHITLTALAVFVVLCIIFLVGLLFYLFPAFNRLSTVPGPSVGDDKFGNISDIKIAGSFHQYLSELHKTYGSVAAFKYGKSFVVSVADLEYFASRSQICEYPDFLYEAWRPLVGDESFLFANQIQSFKRRENLQYEVTLTSKEKFAKVFRHLSVELVKKWHGLSEGQHVPVSLHMKGLAMKAVCSMMFGNYFNEDEKLIQLHNLWDLCWNEVVAFNQEEPTKSKLQFYKARKDLFELLEKAVEHQWEGMDESVIKPLLNAPNLSEEQLLADVVTMFTIGLHVTWGVLTWNFYFLILHASVQTDLKNKLQEIKSLDVMPQSITNIKSLDLIIEESIRCSGMFTCTGRSHDIDVKIGQHVVPKKTPIIEAVAVAMNDENVWKDPYKFHPARFEENNNNLMPSSFIPFAFAANRHDPGNSLVYLFTSIVLASIFDQFTMSAAGHDVQCDDPNYDGFVVMPSRDEIWAVLSASK